MNPLHIPAKICEKSFFGYISKCEYVHNNYLDYWRDWVNTTKSTLHWFRSTGSQMQSSCLYFMVNNVSENFSELQWLRYNVKRPKINKICPLKLTEDRFFSVVCCALVVQYVFRVLHSWCIPSNEWHSCSKICFSLYVIATALTAIRKKNYSYNRLSLISSGIISFSFSVSSSS